MSRDVTVTLTVPQARRLWGAARYLLEQPSEGDGLAGQDWLVLGRALAALGLAIDKAEGLTR